MWEEAVLVGGVSGYRAVTVADELVVLVGGEGGFVVCGI
jgi:hypothetical protein